jgi:hypothetical protein
MSKTNWITPRTLTQILWYQLITAIHDKHTADIKFDIVLLLFVLKKVKGSPSGNEEQCPEFQLTFYREVLKERNPKQVSSTLSDKSALIPTPKHL